LVKEEDLIMRRLASVGAAALVAVLVLTACRSDGDDNGDDNGGGEGVATDFGVTEEACPAAVNPDNGCIYLGILTDLTGPFAGFGAPLTSAQEAFWQRVNEEGGLAAEGGEAYDVDVTTYQENTGYDATEHSRLYEEMKPNILALAQTLGTPTTMAILPDMQASDLVAAPAGYTSLFNFEDVILESSANYCVETMNSVDYAVEEYQIESVMAVHFEGDYGGDAAAGAQIAAEAHGLDFTAVPTAPGAEQQSEAVGRIVGESPDLVIVTTGPTEFAAIVGGAAQNGFTGRFIGTNPTWNPALLESAAAEALLGLVQIGATFPNWGEDTPAHQAMREAIGEEPPDLSDGYTAGWMWQYPVKAALESALASGDLTRAGVRSAATSLTEVDYEGMLPAGAGNYAGGPEAQLRETMIANPDPEAPTGLTTAAEYFVGPTAEAWEPEVCFEALG
jgi:ABC-type branched-subunit amino acid transport system substrate-binding protein